MKNQNINCNEVFCENLTKEDFKIIKGCLLTTKETFKCIPFKNSDIKNRIKQIDEVLNKINAGA